MLASQNKYPSKGRCVHVFNEQVGSFQNIEDSFWVSLISGLMLSLDVAPLNIVGRYMDDVYPAVQDYQHRPGKSSSDASFEREPLFPLPSFPLYTEANSEVLRGPITSAVNMVSSTASQQLPKKSMAAALVESTKINSVSLVPKEIVKLARRFFPFFDPSLFPHKPPSAAVVNRVLFTDAEAELLALGLIEYNTDWKAIPVSSMQLEASGTTFVVIFVRQKNRCSSKAPENPIKAVRRLKTFSIDCEEITCIQEGRKVYKLDWMSVWRFFVPHRDPSLLPQQWHVAFGTQRSYKQDEAKKEWRCLYESKRKKRKTGDLASWQTASGKEDDQTENAGRKNKSGDESTDNAGQGYAHQAYLADWRPGGFNLNSSARPCRNVKDKSLPRDILSQEGTHIRDQQIYDGSGEA